MFYVVCRCSIVVVSALKTKGVVLLYRYIFDILVGVVLVLSCSSVCRRITQFYRSESSNIAMNRKEENFGSNNFSLTDLKKTADCVPQQPSVVYANK